MKKEKIKLAIFDIDETLITRGKQTVEESARKGIEILKENGIEVLIATGRAFYFIHDDIHTSVSPNYYVSTNGSCVYDKNHDLVFKVAMDQSEVDTLIKYSRDNDLGIALKAEHNMPVYNDIEIYRTVYLQGLDKQEILVDYTHEEPFAKEDVMGIFMMGDEKLISSSSDMIDAVYAKAYDGAYDVYSKEAGKIKGIEYVLNELGLDWDSVISFGDADNDIEMIQKSLIGVAMGNSYDSLKEHADYITDDIDQDGIYNALKHFELI